jgi:SAM-dependent methyltransferase
MNTQQQHQGDLSDRVAHMDLLPRTIRNVRMQYRLAVHTLLPWLQRFNLWKPGVAVCEIGCAEGGVLAAFVERGTSYALGTDIQGALLTDISDPVWTSQGLDIEFSHHDVIYEDIPEAWRERFDVVLLRDVIEHLDDAQIALRNIQRLLKPGGVVVVTFPPYTSPFGGHQQLLGTKLGAIPFIHLLPWSIFSSIIKQGEPVNQEELVRLHQIRLSAADVRRAAAAAQLRVVDERLFALRPVFRWKYELPIPSLEVSALRSLPGVRALAMEAAFILQRPV